MTTATARRPRATKTKSSDEANTERETMQEVAAIMTPADSEPATTNNELERVIDTLRGRTLEMSFTVHGLPGNRQIKGIAADAIAAAVGGKKKGVRSSWRLFTSEHPAVADLNAAVRDLSKLRDNWTIVRSAEVKKGEGGAGVAIEGGVRLIWDQDVDEFYRLFVAVAERIDRAAVKVQTAMTSETSGFDSRGNAITVPSIMDMDRLNAGTAWESAAYPADVTKVVGVAKDRDTHGNPVLDENGQPKYVITFSEYHVSEKLPKLLQERAEERVREGLAGTIETAMQYVVAELSESIETFRNEVTDQLNLHPRIGGDFEYLIAEGDCRVIKVLHSDQDPTVPAGNVKLYVKYKADQNGRKVDVGTWLGPMKQAYYEYHLHPETVGKKKAIHTSVIEGIIEKMQSFRDKKAKMLGEYGDQVVAAFQPLMAELTKYKGLHATNEEGARKLANALKLDPARRTDLVRAVGDAIEAMEAKVSDVKEVVRRRNIRRFE